MNNGNAYQGHETWWNSVRMYIKMLLHSAGWGVGIQMVFFLIAVFFNLKTAGLIFTAKFYFARLVHLIGGGSTVAYMFPELLQDVELSVQIANHYKEKIVLYYLTSLPVAPIVFSFAVGFFKKRGQEQSKPEYIRGAKIKNESEMNSEIKKSDKKTDFRIGGVSLPVEAEIQHVFVLGRPRQGKTQMLNPIIEKAKKRKGARGVVFDFKGEFWGQFGDESKGDKLFNPLDVRTLGWTVFNDIKRVTDIDLIAGALIPPPAKNSDPIWTEGAKDIFTSILKYCYFTDRKTNKAVWECVTASGEKLAEMFSQVPGCERGLKHLQDPTSRTALSFLTELMVYAKGFEFLAHADGDFSICDWLEKGEGWIFVASYSDVKDTLRPITGLFIDFMISKHLSMKEDVDRRVYYFLDEMTALGRLPSIEMALNQGAGKGASVWILLQAFGQLDSVYGRDIRDAIYNGCGTSVVFSVADPNTAKLLSDKVGETEYFEKEISLSYGVGDNRDGENFRQAKRSERLLLPIEIQNLKKFECLVNVPDHGLTKTTIPFKKYPLLQEPFMLKKEFDLEEIVKRQQELKAQEKKLNPELDLEQDQEQATATDMDFPEYEQQQKQQSREDGRRGQELDIEQY